MTLTLDRTPAALDWLDRSLDRIRAAVARAPDADSTARSVAKVLHRNLPPLAILTAQQQLGSPEAYQQHVLHVEPDGTFSVLALVWRPGQFTSIHDHVCWGVVGVLAGVEHEVRYALRRRGGRVQLVERDQGDSFPGQVTGFAPPGDIHQVRNDGADVAVSLHIYGVDIGVRGSSVRRTYPPSLRRTSGGGPHRAIIGSNRAPGRSI